LSLIESVETRTAGNDAFFLNIAFNYGGRDEIIRAARRAAEAHDGDLSQVSEADFARYLDTAGLPDPDLVIRTSGEHRISNFLLWQAAYAEFVFMDVLWPDFDKSAFQDALSEYASRDRRYGGVRHG
jgi:undecaprenyl diphosphate synthase